MHFPAQPWSCYRCARRFTTARYLVRHLDDGHSEGRRLLQVVSA